MSDLGELLAAINDRHHRRRFAMKMQQRMDRSLEAFVRTFALGYRSDMIEPERAKASKAAAELIELVRTGAGDDPRADLIFAEVLASDQARRHADALRKTNERDMRRLAKRLPVWPWWDTIRGVTPLGLATIIGETGDIGRFPKHGHLWKRLGYAPHDGHAPSTWRRETWRPRTLTSEEWIELGYSAERYALMRQLAEGLRNSQIRSAEKSGTEYGEPTGRYGEAYVRRREHTAITHPDWTRGHAQDDALRYAMKRLLRDLWQEWRRANDEGMIMSKQAEPAADDSRTGAEYNAPEQAMVYEPAVREPA